MFSLEINFIGSIEEIDLTFIFGTPKLSMFYNDFSTMTLYLGGVSQKRWLLEPVFRWEDEDSEFLVIKI